MLPLFSLTIFVGAALLFLVEPMAAKMALPRLGGSPAVWNTCMMFFQAALLAGYALAHWSIRALGVRRQAVMQAVVVLVPLALLPVVLRGEPAGGASPAAWLLKALTLGVGLPFVVVSTGGPVLQRWFAATGHRSGKDPYFLYAASNAGSLLALLAYPVVVEPWLGLAEQARVWMWGYWGFAALVVGCAGVMWGRKTAEFHAETPRAQSREERAAEKSSPVPALTWVVLAFIPSSLTLGVTQFFSTDIAAVPLLWVVPLAIYLLTFVVAFGGQRPGVALMARVLPVAALAIVISFLLDARRPAAVLIPLHLVTLFVAALLCHSRLALTRPPAARLTEFYLLIALGGVLGGVFNALVAPVVFNSVLEYPIVLVLALLARPRAASRFDKLPRGLLLAADIAVPVLVGGLGLTLDSHVKEWLARHTGGDLDWVRPALTFGVPAVIVYVLSTRPVGFALGITAMFALALFVPKQEGAPLLRERTFFGVYTVSRSTLDTGAPWMTTLTHGTTMHGQQYAATGFQHIALGYYHIAGPIGQVFTQFGGTPLASHVGVIGLGTGGLASYMRPGQRMTFHEIDPAVLAIASNPEYFTYLKLCKGQWDVALGDGRLTMRAAPDGEYGIIILDAFTSDAIPLHLLTREAVGVYLSKLKPGGLLAFHISNQFLTLEPVLARIAGALGLTAVIREDEVSEKARHGNLEGDAAIANRALTPEAADEIRTRADRFPSVWVVMVRDRADLGVLATDARWRPAETRPSVGLWTDEFSNIWSVFEWK